MLFRIRIHDPSVNINILQPIRALTHLDVPQFEKKISFDKERKENVKVLERQLKQVKGN